MSRGEGVKRRGNSHEGLGLKGVWMGLCGEFVIRAALTSARFLHGGWKRISV